MDILSGEGYTVDSVHNGYELLAYLEGNNPAIIILDLMMPEKNGLSIIDSLKIRAPYSRVIIYSGFQEYENSVYARAVDRFIVKGGEMKDLVEAVAELS